MSENKVILATSRISTIHDDYDMSLGKLAKYCYDVSKTKRNGYDFCHIFKVKPEKNSFEVFLDGFENTARPLYMCNTCAHFINTYGNAVYINKDGSLQSIFWNPEAAVGKMVPIVKALKENVEKGEIIDIIRFKGENDLSTGEIRLTDNIFSFGDSIRGGYNHFYGNVFHKRGFKYPNINLKYEHDMLESLLNTLTESNVRVALGLATTQLIENHLYLKDKYSRLLGIMIDVANTKNDKYKENKIFRYAYEYHSFLTTLYGSSAYEFLKDIEDGIDPQECINRYNYKVDPIRYKRPTAAPTNRLVSEAEKTVIELGLTDSLKRRIAKLSDIPEEVIIWSKYEKPKEESNKVIGVFSNVVTKEQIKQESENPVLDLRRAKQRITFNVFRRDILPVAESIKVRIPDKKLGTYNEAVYPFAQYTTEAIPGSAPITKYDSTDPNKRNPFICYSYHRGATKSMFNLSHDEYIEVVAIIPCIELMYDESVNLSEYNNGITFILKGCKDICLKGGLALFPDLLRHELYPVRKVIEAYSSEGTLETIPDYEQSLSGIMLPKNYELNVEVRTVNNTLESFIIDRLE